MATKKERLAEKQKRKADAEARRIAEAKKKRNATIITAVVSVVLVVGVVLLIWQPWADNGKTDSKGDDNTSFSATANNGSSSFVVDESKVAKQDEYKYTYDRDVKHHVEIEVKDYGTIKLELDPTYAPITVDNFLCLAADGFYDGLTFHRIMEGFMVQGGDPDHNGTGGSDTEIMGEFEANGIENPLSHTRGVVSMARNSYSMDSASSQFFIVHEDSLFLDGQYAAFGVVTEGMDVVDAIAEDAKPTDNNGTIKFEEQPVITKVTVID